MSIALLHAVGQTVPDAELRFSNSSVPRRVLGVAPRTFRGAFTLIELLLGILIVGILLSLSVPALRTAKSASRHSMRLSQLRSHVQIMELYTNDSKDIFPFFMNEGKESAMLSVGAHRLLYKYFDSSWIWNWGFGMKYYPGGARDSAFRAPCMPPVFISESYYYAAAMVARPSFWVEKTRLGPVQWLPVRGADVLFPSAKALVTNQGELALSTCEDVRFSMAMADGSTYDGPSTNLVAPLSSGEGPFGGSFWQVGLVGMHTVGGAMGRDIQSR